MLEKTTEPKMGNYKIKKGLSSFGKRIVQIGKQAAREAIAKHKAMGNPIYYKEKGKLIKELADGTRYLVKASIDGIEIIRKL